MYFMKEKIVLVDGCRTPFLRSETDFLNTMTYELGQLSIKGLINKRKVIIIAVFLNVRSIILCLEYGNMFT